MPIVTFDQMLSTVLDMVGEEVDAQVLSVQDDVPLLVAVMRGTLTGALPLDFYEEGGPDEAIHVAIGDGGARVLNRWGYTGASADNPRHRVPSSRRALGPQTKLVPMTRRAVLA